MFPSSPSLITRNGRPVNPPIKLRDSDHSPARSSTSDLRTNGSDGTITNSAAKRSRGSSGNRIRSNSSEQCPDIAGLISQSITVENEDFSQEEDSNSHRESVLHSSQIHNGKQSHCSGGSNVNVSNSVPIMIPPSHHTVTTPPAAPIVTIPSFNRQSSTSPTRASTSTQICGRNNTPNATPTHRTDNVHQNDNIPDPLSARRTNNAHTQPLTLENLMLIFNQFEERQKALYNNILHEMQRNHNQPDDYNNIFEKPSGLPLDSLPAFDLFGRDVAILIEVENYLVFLGGSSLIDATNQFITDVMTNELCRQFGWSNKQVPGFPNVRPLYNTPIASVIFRAAKRCPNFRILNRQEFEHAMSKAIGNAKQRCRDRRRRHVNANPGARQRYQRKTEQLFGDNPDNNDNNDDDNQINGNDGG